MPADADVTVLLTFDFCAISSQISLFQGRYSSQVSHGEFATVGVTRVLRVLADFAAPATFFVPGHTALAYPEQVLALAEAGHEVGHHGWVHEVPSELTPQEEPRVFERGLAALEQVLSTRPTGYRAPGWSLSERSVEILLAHDFAYDSSMMASDYHPYWCRVGDRAPLDEPFEFGRQVPVVELPVAWHLDDVPFFSFVMAPGGTFQGLRNPADVYDIWRAEFDYLYREERNGIFLLTMHPEVIGHGHRLPMLRRLLEHISAHEGVRFATCAAHARQWRAGNALPG